MTRRPSGDLEKRAKFRGTINFGDRIKSLNYIDANAIITRDTVIALGREAAVSALGVI